MEDFLVLVLVAFSTSLWLILHRLFSFSPFRRSLSDFSSQFFDPGKFTRFPESTAQVLPPSAPNNNLSSFVLSDHSLLVSRSLWRIVEYIMADFVDHWYVYCSPSNVQPPQRYNSEFPNDIRDMFEFMFNTISERCLKVNWTHFLVKNLISNLNFLLRIYRLTETELNANNPFYSSAPEKIKQKLLKAELMRVYTLHSGVTQPQLYLRKVSTALLSRILRPADFHCVALLSLTREILTNNVLILSMSFMTPYWLNVGIINMLTPYLEKKKQKKENKENQKDENQATNKEGENQANYEGENGGANGVNGEGNTVTGAGEGESGEYTGVSSGQASKESLLTQKIAQWSTEKQKRKANKEAAEKYHTMQFPLNVGATQQQQANLVGSVVASSILDSSAPVETRPHAATVAIHTRAGNIIKATPIQPSNRSIPVQNQPKANMPIVPLQRSTSSLHGFGSVAASVAPRWEVRIVGAGIRFDPKPYVAYELLVTHGDAKYVVIKRFQRFEDLHQKLKKSIANFDAQLPRKHFFGNLDQAFIQHRKQELQIYLGQLLWNRNVQESEELKQFLAPDDKIMMPQTAQQQPGQQTHAHPNSHPHPHGSAHPHPHAHNRSATGSGTINFTAPTKESPATAAEDSKPLQTLSETPLEASPMKPQQHSPTKAAARRRSEAVIHPVPTHSPDEGVPNPSFVAPFNAFAAVAPGPVLASQHTSTVFGSSAAPQASPSKPARQTSNNASQPSAPQYSVSPPSSDSDFTDGLTDPLYILVEEMFDLNSRGWVRRQATWITKQLVKLTADKVIKNWFDQLIKFFLTEEQLAIQIDWITGLIWKDGKIQKGAQVTPEEAEAVKSEAEALLLASIPSSLKTMLGTNHCEVSLRRFFQFIQMEPLIQHFGYSVLDSLLLELFPELAYEGLGITAPNN